MISFFSRILQIWDICHPIGFYFGHKIPRERLCSDFGPVSVKINSCSSLVAFNI